MNTKSNKNIMIKKVYGLGLLALGFCLLAGNSVLAAEEATPIPETVAAVTDTIFPSDVSNVKAVGKDKMITLSWDAATDNVGVTGYKIFYGANSVSSDTASYTEGPIDVKNVLTYDVKPLENTKTYYFAVTAYDAAGNESEFYSTEASATVGAAGSTTAAVDDKAAPKVVSATVNMKNQVKVIFSEGVKLPANKPEAAFSIKDDFLGTGLTVTQATMDSTDKSNKTVLLLTSDQKKASKYILTAGIQIQDLAGNPIVSGTSDTAVFTAPDPAIFKAAEDTTTTKPAADAEAPKLSSVKAMDAHTVEVVFSEPVTLLTNASENFIVTDTKDNTKITNVTKVAISQNGTKATLTTEELKAQPYNLIVIKVKDLAGNTMEVANSATTFDGVAATVTTPATTNTPTNVKVEEAASDLAANALANLAVNLTWKSKEDKLANVASFVAYMSTDRGATYGTGVTLGKDKQSYSFNNLKSDMVYYFKLTTKDATGKESEGLVTYLTLPKTGPGLILLLFGSAGAGAFITRKKKK